MAKPENISIPANEYEIKFQLASGPGGQHVNKVSSAVRLSFDIEKSDSLSAYQKHKLKNYGDKRIGKDGVIMILVASNRSQIRNREEAVQRLHELIEKATKKKKKRIPTKMSRAAKEKIKKNKKKRSEVKKNRKKIHY